MTWVRAWRGAAPGQREGRRPRGRHTGDGGSEAALLVLRLENVGVWVLWTVL